MESETQRTARLQAMQMADLGTARREHVSTVDKHSHFENVKLSELEAHRQSNIPGTLAYKQAQKHKDGLQGWRDLHKTVSDETQIDTQLDDMMHGQSHRAQLNEQLHGSAKPTVPISSIKKSPHLPKQAFAVNRSTNEVIKNHPLPPRQSGRGGGVIGGRGRGNFSPKVNTGSRVSLGPIPTGKDPALDRNNVSPPVRGRGISKRGGSSSRGSLMRGITRSPRGVSPRDDTPLCQHFNKIVTPQQFMAQVRWASNFGAISQQETASPLQEKVGILAKQVEVVPKKEEPLTPLKAIHEIPTSLQVPKEAISPLKRKIGAVAKQVEVLPKKKESLASVKAIHEEPEISSDSTGSEVLLDIGAEIKFEPSLDLFSSPSLADLDGLDFGKQPGNPASLASGIIEPPQKEEEMDKFAEVFARIFETMPGLKEKIDSKLKLSPTTPPQAAFQEYRSRATTASSTDSSGEKPYEVDVRASPKNLVPHEGIKGFGALRLTESSSQNSDSKKPTGGLTQSIYASAAPRANFRGHSRENSSVVARPAPRPARTIGPQPYNPLAARAGNTQNTTPELQTVIPKGVEELKPRIRTIGPPPWQGSKKA